jgi:hypothetical protein
MGAALTASPQLHELVYHSAGDNHHECLACTLQAGAEPAPTVIVSVHQVVEAGLAEKVKDIGFCGSFFLSCRELEHAPPRLLEATSY